MRFSNRTALVTGAGSGIGRATARRLADEGATVVVTDVDGEGGAETVSLIEDAGGDAEFRHLDVRDAAEMAATVEATADEHGLDVLVNNAGTGHPPVPLEHVPDRWRDDVIETNLLGTWNGCKAALPHMKAQGGGAIVNVSSIMATRAAGEQAAYCMTKSALLSFTASLAKEAGPDGVRVTAVCPGFIETPLTSRLAEEGPEDGWDRERIPLRRFGDPAEVASAIAFLASEDAAFVNGEYLVVDGGTTG